MKAKQPREIADRWNTSGKQEPEYVGEWHLFVWPSRTTRLAYYVGYRTYMFRGKTRFAWLCSCMGYWTASKDNKINGTECYHIRQLKEEVEGEIGEELS